MIVWLDEWIFGVVGEQVRTMGPPENDTDGAILVFYIHVLRYKCSYIGYIGLVS